MSRSLSNQRDRVQREVETLQQCLSATNAELELLSTDTDDESDSDAMDEEVVQNTAGLLAQRDKIQKQIQNLEEVLGPHSPLSVSSTSGGDSSSEESDLDLPLSVESCLQVNLVYQQVLQETLDQLETLLANNQKQQRELMYQLSGPIKEPIREQPTNPSYQQPIKMYLGRFLKPYFKDKLTGLGPPANQETKEKASRMVNCLEDKKMKTKRWESWQKTLLIYSVTRDSLRRLIQPKLSKVDYLSQKLSSAEETDRQQLAQQIDSLEKEIDLIRLKREEELISGRHEEHDWDKIANIDFEGTKEAEDIRCFWQNYLHPSINKSGWSHEEVQQLKEISSRHGHRQWEDIATELGTGRTAFMCLQTFQRFVSDSLKHRIWTPAEDALLRELVDKMRIGNFIPYTQMSYFMEGRDPGQLIYRWIQVLDPSLRKGPWSKEEDELLLGAVSRHGEKNWWKIRLEVPGRSDCACRDRYVNSLKAGMKRGAFDTQEKALLLELIHKHGVGCWSKIAAEIPNRFDAQCLREWKKLKKEEESLKLSHKSPWKSGRSGRRKASSLVKRKIRGRLKTLDEDNSEEEEEEMVVYMDNNDEEYKENEDVMAEEEAGEEDNYVFPPIQEWIPSEKTSPLTFVKFQTVGLQFSNHSQKKECVRSTVLGPFGWSVIVGPKPKELMWEERHCGHSMLMVTPEQLRTQLSLQAQRCRSRRPSQKLSPGQSDVALGYQLQAAVTPWIGHLLIPIRPKKSVAHSLQEHTQTLNLSSTQVFLLLLQAMNVDIAGCKDMIRQRKHSMAYLTPPPDPCSLRKKRVVKETRQQSDSQNTVIPNQASTPPPPQPPPQSRPAVFVQMPSKKRSLGFPVLYTHPVFQPLQSQLTSFKLIPCAQSPASLTTPTSTPVLLPMGFMRLPIPNVSPISVGQLSSFPQSSTSTCILNLSPVVIPSAQNLEVAIPCSTKEPGSVEPVSANQHPVTPPFTSTPPAPHQPKTQTKRRRCKNRGAVSRKQNEADYDRVCAKVGGASDLVGGASDLVGGASDLVGVTDVAVSKTGPGLILEGKRIRKPSAKARALQETAKVKANKKANKKATAQPNCVSAKKTDVFPPPQPHCSSWATPLPVSLMKGEAQSVPGFSSSVSGASTGVFQTGDCVDLSAADLEEASAGVIQKGKKVLKPSWKTRALREATETEVGHQSHGSFPPKKRTCLQTDPLKKKGLTQDKGLSQTPTFCGFPGLTTQISAPPVRLQLAACPALTSDLPTKAPPSFHASHAQFVPGFVEPRPLPALPVCQVKSPPAAFLLPSLSTGPSPSSGSSTLLPFLPQADSPAPPVLRREVLQFDPSLMFLETKEEVQDWLSGGGGVVVPGLNVALPYLPPFVCSLAAVGALLRAKKRLTKSSQQLLCDGTKDPLTTKPDAGSQTACQPPPDSTSDLRPADTPDSSVTVDPQNEQEEAELVAIRQLVAERFTANPAYQMLKARFLSCFTLPALLAAVQPITAEPKASHGEEEEEKEVLNIKESVRRRRAQSSLLLHDCSGAPANHYAGIKESKPAASSHTQPD